MMGLPAADFDGFLAGGDEGGPGLANAQGSQSARAIDRLRGMNKTAICPRCGVEIQSSGEVSFDGKIIPVFQCEKCLAPGVVLDIHLDLPFTFCLDADGRAFEPPEDAAR